MKEGTLVMHYRGGNVIVPARKATGIRFPVAMDCCGKPVTTPQSREQTISSVYVTELTTMSKAE